MHGFLGLVVLVLAQTDPASAQAVRVDVTQHPEDAREVVAFQSDTQRAVYRSDDHLLFESGDSRRTVDVEGPVLHVESSSSAAFVALMTVDSAAPGLRLRSYTAEGELVGEHLVAHHPDERLPQVALSDAGGAVAYARPETAEVCFLTSDRCVFLFEDAEYAMERNVLVEYDPRGQFVAVAAQRQPAGPSLTSGSNSFLFLFRSDGSLMWRQPIAQPAVRALGVSQSGTIAVSSYDSSREADIVHHTQLYDRSGAETVAARFGADEFVFDSSGVLLVTARSLARIGADGESNLVMQAEPGSIILSVAALEGELKIAVLTGRSVYTDQGFASEDLRLTALGERGQVVDVEEVEVEAQRSAILEADASSGGVSLVLDRATHTYRWAQ